jgi:hypothetical protein
LKYSVPKSMPSTPEAAEADAEKRSRTKRGRRDKRGGLFLRPGGNIMREKLGADFGVCLVSVLARARKAASSTKLQGKARL